jgi:hypothetical protein
VALAVLEWQDSGSLGRWLVLEGLLGTGLVFTALFAVGLQQPGRSEPRRGIVLLLVIVVLWAAVLILGDMRQSLDVPDALLQPWPPLLLALAGLSLLLLSIGSGGLAYARLRGRPVRRWTAAILVTGLLPALTAGALLMPRMGQESPPHTALSLAFGLALVVGSLPFASASNGRLTPGVAGPVCRGVLFYLAALGCLFAAAVSPQRFADSSAAFGLLAFAGTGCLRLTAYLAVLDWLRRRWPALAPALFWSLYTAVEMSVSLFGTTPPTLAEDWQPLGALDAFSRACSALEQSQHLTHDLGWSLGGVPASSESEAFFIPLLLTAAAALLALLLPRLRRVRPATAAPAAVRLPRRARPAPADWRGTLSRLSPLLAALARQEARWLSSAHPSFCSACFSGH